MKRILLILGCCLLFSQIFGSSAQTVILDAGHGGADGGAVSQNNVEEKDLNLTLALLLRDRLQQDGHQIIMTRESDTDTDGQDGFYKRRDLERRVEVAAESDAVLFVSLHMNASTSPQDKGFQVFHTKQAASRAAAIAIRTAVEQAHITLRMRELKTVPADLYLFKHLPIPSVLVECGFLSNPEDEALLTDPTFMEKMADALAKGISEWCCNEKF